MSQTIIEKAMSTACFMFADTDLKFDLPQARVNVDREKVLTSEWIWLVLLKSSVFSWAVVTSIALNYFNRSYQVNPQLAEEERKSISSLMDLKIRTPSGELIPVSSFATIEPTTAPRSLKLFQQQAAIQIFW